MLWSLEFHVVTRDLAVQRYRSLLHGFALPWWGDVGFKVGEGFLLFGHSHLLEQSVGDFFVHLLLAFPFGADHVLGEEEVLLYGEVRFRRFSAAFSLGTHLLGLYDG